MPIENEKPVKKDHMPFNKTGLSHELLMAVKDQGYEAMTPIQTRAIPAIMQGQDVIAVAQTGTGKTAAFTLPMLHHLIQNPKEGKQPRILVLTPTRELAAQVRSNVVTYGKHTSLTSLAVFGGVNINPQICKLRKRKDILIATPGRLLDLVNRKVVKLGAIEICVLDEADRMLDMGFMPDIKRILALIPKKRQNLLFSATFANNIKKLAEEILTQPSFIEVKSKQNAHSNISQLVHPVDKSRKRELLSFMIGSNNWQQVLVFTRTKYQAERLAVQLKKDGLKAGAIHGDKSQAVRTKTLAAFKDGKLSILVATDVASRGLDIQKLPHVVNFELPDSPEDYVHRIGRTGRASHKGSAIALVSADEIHRLRSIEQLLKTKLPQQVIAGYEPTETPKEKAPKKPSSKRNTRKPRRASPKKPRANTLDKNKGPTKKNRKRSSKPSAKRTHARKGKAAS